MARAAGLEAATVAPLLEKLARRNAIIRPAAEPGRPRTGAISFFRFRHGAYAEAAAEHAPILQQIFAARRLGRSGSTRVPSS